MSEGSSAWTYIIILLSGVGLWWQQVDQVIPDVSSSSFKDLEAFPVQTGYALSPAGSGSEEPPWKDTQEGPDQMLNPIRWLYSELLTLSLRLSPDADQRSNCPRPRVT